MAVHKKFGRMGRIIAMIVLTSLYFFVEIITGHITGSIALVADSFHMLSDVVALIVGLVAVKISKMNSPKSTFGWVRAEVLGALVNSVFLLALCFTIFVDAVQRLVKTEDVENPTLMLAVGSVGLGINLIGLFIFRDHSHGHSHGGHSHGSKERKNLLKPDAQMTDGSALRHQKQQPTEQCHVALGAGDNSIAVVAESDEMDDEDSDDRLVIDVSDSGGSRGQLQPNLTADAKAAVDRSRVDADSHCASKESKKGKVESSSQLNMRAIFLHVLGDALGSVVVIVSSLLIWLVPDVEGEGHIHWKPYIDPVLSLVLVAIIISTTIPLLKESALILLQAVPAQLKVRDIRQALEKMEGVLAVRELHLWQLTGSRHVASLHLSVVSLEDYIRLSSIIGSYFRDNGVHSVTIQPEFTELHVELTDRQEFDRGKTCSVDLTLDKMAMTHANGIAVTPPRLQNTSKSSRPLKTSPDRTRLDEVARPTSPNSEILDEGADSVTRLLADVPSRTTSSTCCLGGPNLAGNSASVAPGIAGLRSMSAGALGHAAARGGGPAEGPPIG